MSNIKNGLIRDVRLPYGLSNEEAVRQALKKEGMPLSEKAFVLRRSLDARRKELSEVFTIALADQYKDYSYDFKNIGDGKRVLIVGFGPAGMFAAYLLAKFGFCPTVAERGRDVERRVRDVETFWKTGVLDPVSNVQFGEGGAGTFSDGKLTTRINDERCRFVLHTFRDFGADEKIMWQAKPHIGTDVLRNVVTGMREQIKKLGGEVLYETKLTDITVENGKLKEVFLNGEPHNFDAVVLATGNGAKETYELLLSKPLTVENKPFSVGFRAEFLQTDIDRAVYGKNASDPRLPPADFQFFTHLPEGTVYTFCMCPGGFVVNSSSDEGCLVTNGMSYSGRDGKNANAAFLATVSASSPKEALEMRMAIEKAAYSRFSGKAPVTLVKNFLEGSVPSKFGHVEPTFLPDTGFDDFGKVFPYKTLAMLKKGMSDFGKRFFHDPEAVLTAPETRTSAPMRIVRDESFQAVGARGLYPCGEGAGYAGGIMSSAVDGLRVAEAIIGLQNNEK
ncbi:MAG: FAD-dependent oxidoreductase [Clostridia bacterium]|nr:FAD-dependent oxidoreductase [Clostridia bacterium]